MLTNRGWRNVAQPVLMVAGVMVIAAVVHAEDANVSQYQTSYQPAPGPVPSGNIIGYKPIPQGALETAMMGQAVPAPSQASPAYPGAVQPEAYAAAVAVPGSLTPANGAAAPGQLPVTYLTGIVGEGFYTLGRDDVIRVDVRGQPEFSGTFMIGFDGHIQYNYLGDIPMAGLTKHEVQQVLEKMLQRYIRVPQVNVMIVAYNSKVVYVIGEVNNPGKFIMRGDAIKLREAILAAGLPTDRAALGRVHVIKPDLEHPTVRVIDVKRILYKGQLKDDVDLTSGEIVVLPSTVLSAVNRFLSGLLSPVTRAARFAALAAI